MQPKALLPLWLAVWLSPMAPQILAQGTAFSYQGRLTDGGSPANTNYDLRFGVFTAPTGGTQISAWVTNCAVTVSGGLFAVTLDFGPGLFNGTPNGSNDWLDVAVKATNLTAFTTLTPRQPILPAPYAGFAANASNLLGQLPATQLAGTLASSQLSGIYSNAVTFVNTANTFGGNGSGLTGLTAAQVANVLSNYDTAPVILTNAGNLINPAHPRSVSLEL